MAPTAKNRETGLGRGSLGAIARTAGRIALSSWVLSLLCAAAALAIMFLGWSAEVPIHQTAPVLYPALLATAFSTVGTLIASRRPENAIGWIMCATGVLFGLNALADSYAAHALYSNPEQMPGAALAAWANVFTGNILLFPFLLLLFPDGRLPSRRWRPVVWLIFGTILAEVAASAFAPGHFSGWPPARNPFGVAALGPPLDLYVSYARTPLLALAVLLPASSLVVRFRQSRAVERQQLKWIASSGVLVAFAVTLLVLVGTRSPELIEGVLWGFLVLTLCAIPLSMGVAILRYRLWDIDLLINRALVYGTLTACVFGIYALVVGGLGVLLQTQGNLLVSILAAGIVAVLFQPLRYRLQHGINHMMYGERDEPYTVLSRLGQRLEGTLNPDTVLSTVVKTIAEALKVPYAAVEIDRNNTFETAAATGKPMSNPLRLPLVYGGETVGRLVLGSRTGSEHFTSADQRLLDDLARQIGTAVHAARLTEEAMRLSADLQNSRQRLVTAREEERRRLRRDLHDGLGPQLASLTMRAEAARDLIPEDASRADEVLAGLTEQAQAAVADIRRLVYALRPPALDALGLLGALRSHVFHHDHGGVHVTVKAPEELPSLPAAVEVAAYLIALEATNNVTRHADARNCVICLALTGDTLRLEVSDDGKGIAEDRAPGVGLVSMRERTEELGGFFAVEGLSAGGTCVRATLPYVRDEAFRLGRKEERE